MAGKRMENADTIATHARVFVRRARADGHSNKIDRMLLDTIASNQMGLIEGVDFSMRTVLRLVRSSAKMMGETDLLDL